MKTKIYNYDRLKEETITDQIIRVKAIIVNDQEEVLLGEAYDTIQFPGGHLEVGETLNDALKREMEEETGIILKQEYEPFFCIKHFLKDYPEKNKNCSIEIYYYAIFTNETYHTENMHLDKQEQKGEYHLYYVPIKDLKNVLQKKVEQNPINKVITREMLEATRIWRKQYGSKKI